MDLFSQPVLILRQEKIGAILPLLQQGFGVKTKVGTSIRDFLCVRLGLAWDYVENRVKTIFLDGQPVDDPDAAWVEDGSVLALSAAMPGLAGAVLRRGGGFAALRESITYRKGQRQEEPRDGIVTVKLFNLLASELGPVFVRQGILVSRKNLERLLRNGYREAPEGWAESMVKSPEGMGSGHVEIRLDG